MRGAQLNEQETFCLTVSTADSAKAFGMIAKFERPGKSARISFSDGFMSVSVAQTVREMPAQGSWARPVFFRTLTLGAFAKTPPTRAHVVIRVDDGKLMFDNFGVSCSFVALEESGGDPGLEDSVKGALRILSRYHLDRTDIDQLVANAKPDYAMLWGPADESILADIASAWTFLAPHGVEAAEIRRVVNERLRGALKSPGRSK